VMYWTMIGGKSEYAGLDRKFAEIHIGLTGIKPDGLLFRISNINKNTISGIAMNDSFAAVLINALAPAARQRLTGLN